MCWDYRTIIATTTTIIIAFASAGFLRDWPQLPLGRRRFQRFSLAAILEEEIMDRDRIAGSGKQIKGAVKQVIGKAVGDTKLEWRARRTG